MKKQPMMSDLFPGFEYPKPQWPEMLIAERSEPKMKVFIQTGMDRSKLVGFRVEADNATQSFGASDFAEVAKLFGMIPEKS